MEYTKGKNILSKLMKSALSIGTFILLLVTIPYIAIFIIRAILSIAVFGVLVWGSFKIIKAVKNFIYKIGTNKTTDVQSNIYNSDIIESDDTNYADSVIIDVDYEKVE